MDHPFPLCSTSLDDLSGVMSVHSVLLFNRGASDLPVFLLSEIIREMHRNNTGSVDAET